MISFRLIFAYIAAVPRDLTPVQVLSILIQRMEKSANAWEGVRLSEYELAVGELRRYADMLRRAREYLIAQQKR